jgi:hypothetical protein
MRAMFEFAIGGGGGGADVLSHRTSLPNLLETKDGRHTDGRCDKARENYQRLYGSE